MGTNTKIEWADHTWNPWLGCTHVSEGCVNCYAERDMTRYGHRFGEVRRAARDTFEKPISQKWRSGDRVFVCSWSDFFHPDADGWRDDAWNIMRRRDDLIYLIPTKRPGRIRECLPSDWGEGWPNVWLGVSVENQKRADERISALLEIPAAVRFVSAEPLLEEVDIFEYLPHLEWVVAGCESKNWNSPGRPADIEWFRLLQNHCRWHRVPFFLKQVAINGRQVHMPELDGQVWAQVPGDIERGEQLAFNF